MKSSLILLFTFVIVCNVYSFQNDPAEEFESIILEKPWFVQIGLADRSGIAIKADYNYSLSIGKYLEMNYALKLGLKYGNDISDIDRIYSRYDFFTSNSKSDSHTYGFNIVGLYNFMPAKRLQFSAGLYSGYEFTKTTTDQKHIDYEGISTGNYESNRQLYSFGITKNINYFIMRNISLYIQNLILFSIEKYDSEDIYKSPYESNSYTVSSSEWKSVSFDNLLLGLGIYF